MEMLLEFLIRRERGLVIGLLVVNVILVFFNDVVVELGQVLDALDDCSTTILLLLLVLFLLEGVFCINGDGNERVNSIRRGTIAFFIISGSRFDACPVFWNMC
jgi:TctA family transporter